MPDNSPVPPPTLVRGRRVRADHARPNAARDDASRLRVVAERELATAGLVPDRLEIAGAGEYDWGVSMTIAGRDFEIGCVPREGFFCWERTIGRQKDFVANDCGAFFGRHGRLLREGLGLVRYALANPEFGGVTRPVI